MRVYSLASEKFALGVDVKHIKCRPGQPSIGFLFPALSLISPEPRGLREERWHIIAHDEPKLSGDHESLFVGPVSPSIVTLDCLIDTTTMTFLFS